MSRQEYIEKIKQRVIVVHTNWAAATFKFPLFLNIDLPNFDVLIYKMFLFLDNFYFIKNYIFNYILIVYFIIG